MKKTSCLSLAGLVVISFIGTIVSEALANRGNPTEWRVRAYKIDLVRDRIGVSGDVLRREDTGWIHLGSNHLEGGSIKYAVPVGRLDSSDILEIWIDGYSESSNPDVGPTILVGGRNIGQVTRRVGDSWKPKVFRFADDLTYGDLTEPSNRNESWRIRFPSNKYDSNRINRDPGSLVGPDGRVPIEISMTGTDGFVIKRVEVDVYKNITGGRWERGDFHIVDIYPNPCYAGDYVTLRFSENWISKDLEGRASGSVNVDRAASRMGPLEVELYIIDPDGFEHLKAKNSNASTNTIGFLAAGAPFSKTGLYRARMVFRSGSKITSHTDSFYFYNTSEQPYVESPQAYRAPVQPDTEPPQVYGALPPVQPYTEPSQAYNIPPRQSPYPEPPRTYGAPPEPYREPLEEAEPGPRVENRYYSPPPISQPPPSFPPEPSYGAFPPDFHAPPAPWGNYTIQVSANRVHYNAVKLQNHLKRRGYPAYISEIYIPGWGHFFRVRVGSYPNRYVAEREAYNLRIYEGLETWVTQSDPYWHQSSLYPPTPMPSALNTALNNDSRSAMSDRDAILPSTRKAISSGSSKRIQQAMDEMTIRKPPGSLEVQPSQTVSSPVKSKESEIEEAVWNELIKRSIPGYSYEIKEVAIAGAQAQALVVEESRQGKIKKFHYKLKNVDNRWTVQSTDNEL